MQIVYIVRPNIFLVLPENRIWHFMQIVSVENCQMEASGEISLSCMDTRDGFLCSFKVQWTVVISKSKGTRILTLG